MSWDDAAPTKEELKGSWDSVPPTKEELGKSFGGAAQTALEHGANAATLGYLPQLQAAAAKPIYKALNSATGLNVEPDSYVQERDANVRRLQAEQKENPKSALAGSVAGSLLGAAATPGLGPSSGILNAAGHGALYGAGIGALSNPGDKPGEVNPIQAKDRLQNAESGALTGAVTGGVTEGASKGLQALANSGEKAGEIARTQAVRGAGGMLKDFRSMNARNQTGEIGQFMLDNGLIKAGDTVEDVAQKSSQFKKGAGDKLSEIYQSAHDEALNNASPDQISKINSTGFNPAQDKDEILSSIKKNLGDDADKKAAVNSVSTYLDQLIEDYGDQPLTPKKAQEIKTAMDQKVNYARNPLSKEPATDKGFSAARQYVSKKIDEDLDAIGNASGKPGLLQDLKDANRDYGYSSQVNNMAKDRINRETANRMISLTDTIAGGAGAAAGSAAGGLVGGDYRHAGEGALLAGLAGGLANHAGRKYGPGILAEGANRAQPILENTLVPVGQLGSKIDPALLSRALINKRASEKNLQK